MHADAGGDALAATVGGPRVMSPTGKCPTDSAFPFCVCPSRRPLVAVPFSADKGGLSRRRDSHSLDEDNIPIDTVSRLRTTILETAGVNTDSAWEKKKKNTRLLVPRAFCARL